MTGAVDPALLRDAADLAERGVACALAVVVSTTGSVPGKVGATMLVTVDGTARGTVGGAGLEEKVKALCRDALRRGKGGVHEFDLANWKPAGLDSVCGGTVQVAISVVGAVPHLLLVGGGHCTLALAQVADVLGWGYTVVDSRPEYVIPERFPRARHLAARPPSDFLRAAEDVTLYSHAYLLGHSHHEDGEALIALLERGFPGVVAAIGSRAKMHAFAERAAQRGLDASRVRCPIGVDVGARTPPEIAVAIAAEIIADLRRPREILHERQATADPAR